MKEKLKTGLIRPAGGDASSTTAIAEAIARLKHLLELKRIGLVIGEVGSLRQNHRLPRNHLRPSPGLYRVFYVPLSAGNVMDMYKSIGWELGLPTERKRAIRYRALRTEISTLVLE